MRHAQPRLTTHRADLHTPRSITTSTSGRVIDDSAALVAATILVVPAGAGSKARACSSSSSSPCTGMNVKPGLACSASASSSMSDSPATKMSTAPPRSSPPLASVACFAARRATHAASSSWAETTVAGTESDDSSI
eukprot:scaffold126970_cov63-Phaeocystis_antarctica.AAC.2